MSVRTTFEIRPTDAGFEVIATIGWGDGASRVRGLLRTDPCASREAAISWIEIQFSIPPTAWIEHDGALLAERVVGD